MWVTSERSADAVLRGALAGMPTVSTALLTESKFHHGFDERDDCEITPYTSSGGMHAQFGEITTSSGQ